MKALPKPDDPRTLGAKVAMPAASEQWFGRVPPDLSLETRARGADWVYTYLLSFYLDDSRPMGVNNTVLAGASMPHVLWELQGLQAKVEHAAAAEGHGETKPEAHAAEEGHHGNKFELVQKGKLSPEEYKKFVADITNFMVYAAEPARNKRISTGWNVLIFLSLFLPIAYLLKKEYWKDIH